MLKILILATSLTSLAAQAAEFPSQYNVVWETPSKFPSGQMPLGNGNIAAGVYAIEDGDLYLLLSKNDTYTYTCAIAHKRPAVSLCRRAHTATRGSWNAEPGLALPGRLSLRRRESSVVLLGASRRRRWMPRRRSPRSRRYRRPFLIRL